MTSPNTSYSVQFPLHLLTADEVEAFLMCHHKYLANPLTKKEKALIRDIIMLCQPLVNRKPQFPVAGDVYGY